MQLVAQKLARNARLENLPSTQQQARKLPHCRSVLIVRGEDTVTKKVSKRANPAMRAMRSILQVQQSVAIVPAESLTMVLLQLCVTSAPKANSRLAMRSLCARIAV